MKARLRGYNKASLRHHGWIAVALVARHFHLERHRLVGQIEGDLRADCCAGEKVLDNVCYSNSVAVAHCRGYFVLGTYQFAAAVVGIGVLVRIGLGESATVG